MSKYKVINEIKEEVLDVSFESEVFSSVMDTITVSVSGKSDSDAMFVLYYYDKGGMKSEVYREELILDSSGAFKTEYSFDPISLAVYKNAEKFTVMLSNRGGVLKIESMIIAELLPDAEQDDSSCDNTVIGANGEKLVLVKTIDGEKISVPRVPNKVLFMGNSLVFGLGAYGMCASAPDKDYYHYVTEYIKTYNPVCVFDKLYSSFYEHSENIEMFDNWYYNDVGIKNDPPVSAVSKLSDDIDLIFIQIGDNVNTDLKETTFRKTKDILIERIKKACPRARIIWIHGWYNQKRTNEPIKEICSKWDIERINISALRSRETEAHNQKYFYSVKEGKLLEVKETWITHPGDLGMKKIADKIISKLKF